MAALVVAWRAGSWVRGVTDKLGRIQDIGAHATLEIRLSGLILGAWATARLGLAVVRRLRVK